MSTAGSSGSTGGLGLGEFPMPPQQKAGGMGAVDSIAGGGNRSFASSTADGSEIGSGNRKANADPGFKEFGIENTNIHTAAGVKLSDRQKVLVGSVLDLFAGRPSLPKLSLWTDTATFSDQITKAEGRKQFAAQWYGLQAAFSSIERISHEVVSAGNPIELDLCTKYTVKGVGLQQRIDSRVSIWVEGKIVGVRDSWGGEVPGEGAFVKALRKLNSVVVPAFVGVPKNNQEDAKKGNQ
ncbi:hypothetical protein SBOR_9024 [Sclerotinia borealis F-4128]|uniref:SnoaL-like domain-containing protein n=1 Tax=Sclerotinia borealis (strain F-4128) TaxID=1432307 RepID=W9C3Y0_SCLBF|nr:hypothetical protein SBOR_9024 [Sclerotinia borealis F-4128]